MSKSMNKYHKRSGSGMLPGWVKLGAVAVGVGVGVGTGGWSPGGGSKAWGTPGAYVIKVEKSVFPSGTVKTFVVVKDVMKGLCDSFVYNTEGTSVVFRGASLSGLIEKFFSHAYLVSFSIGGADVCFDEKSLSFSLHSTDKDTSWFIKSHRDIKLSGVFKNCVCETDQKLLIEKNVDCSAIVLVTPYAQIEPSVSLFSDVVVCLRSFLKNYGRIKCASLACLGSISCDDSKCTITVDKQKEKNQWSILKPVSSFDDECAPWRLNDGGFALPFEGDSYISTGESDDGRFLQFPECGCYMCFVVFNELHAPHCDAFVSAKSVDGELLKNGKCLLDQEGFWVSLIKLQIKGEEDRKIRFILRNFSEANIDELNCEKSMLFIFPLNG